MSESEKWAASDVTVHRSRSRSCVSPPSSIQHHSETCSHFDDAKLKCKSRNKTFQIMWFARKTIYFACTPPSPMERNRMNARTKKNRAPKTVRKMFSARNIWRKSAKGSGGEGDGTLVGVHISGHDECCKSHIYMAFPTILSHIVI